MWEKQPSLETVFIETALFIVGEQGLYKPWGVGRGFGRCEAGKSCAGSILTFEEPPFCLLQEEQGCTHIVIV